MLLLTKLADRLFQVARAVAGILFLIAIAINFANIVGRYVFFTPIFWAEEIIVYDIIWCVMLGAALVCWQGQHLRVEIIENFLSARSIARLQLVIFAVVCVVASITAYLGLRVLQLVSSMGQRSVVAEIPMAIPFAAVPIGFLLILAASAVRLMLLYRAARANDQGEPGRAEPPGSGLSQPVEGRTRP